MNKSAKKVKEAAQEYLDRRNRFTHPDGFFDNASRWYPSPTERQDCCDYIRPPSRAHPFNYMTHCRTAKHIANLYSVDVNGLLREAKKEIK